MASADEQIKVFISYSRTDAEFVDRLEASLRSRGFGTWVDRRRLEGGEDWLDEIQHAIEGCQRLVLVLSPAAVASEYVRMEYRHARRTGKPLIPALLLPCPSVPMDLPMLQWVDFRSDYDDGLKHLLIALTRETPLVEDALVPAGTADSTARDALIAAPATPAAQPPEIPLRDLYTAGLAARARDDLERTAIYWDQILERDPSYLEGTVAAEMEAIRPRLTPIRLKRLRETAETAHGQGEWAQEIAAWQGLLALEPTNTDAQAELAIAQENRANAEQYDIARELVGKGDEEAARYQLKLLWSRAKYYGDPAGLAPKLGLTVPQSYHETQQQEQREVQEQERAAGLAARRAQRSVFRRDYLRLSFGLPILFVFGSVLGVGLVVGFITGEVIVVGVLGLLFAGLSYVLGVHRAVHPVAFALLALPAAVVAIGLTLGVRPPSLEPPGLIVPGDQPAVAALPFFYYSDPFTGTRYHSPVGATQTLYPDLPTAPNSSEFGSQVVQLGNNFSFCGDVTIIGLPSGVGCIFNDAYSNSPNAVWTYCVSSDCTDTAVAGTTAGLERALLRNTGEGSSAGFALPLGLLWAALGALLWLCAWSLRVRIMRSPVRKQVPLVMFLIGLVAGAVVGFAAGFVVGAAIYVMGWPVAGFLGASVLAFLASVRHPLNRRVLFVLVAAAIVLAASLLYWSHLMGIAGFLLLTVAIASVCGTLWGLGMSGSLRMWTVRPAIKK